jgi:hypothetical protein
MYESSERRAELISNEQVDEKWGRREWDKQRGPEADKAFDFPEAV